jgi:colicin import membrane protein
LQQKQLQQQAQAQAAARELQAAQAEDARLARLREDNLRRMREQIGAPDASGNKGSTGTALRDAAPSAAYSGRLAALIRNAIVYTGNSPDNAAAEFEVRAGPGGSIFPPRLLKSSGHPDWDEAVRRAIDRVGTLPPDRDGRVPAQLIVSHRPRDQEPGQ